LLPEVLLRIDGGDPSMGLNEEGDGYFLVYLFF
jgi:hypothetical protein